MIITVDGPVATGKSTISRLVAKRLGFIHFETGAMYRCLTAYIQKHKIPYGNESALEKALDQFIFDVKLVEGEKRYFIDEEDVTDLIRGPKVSAEVSKIAALRLVREQMVAWQRTFAEKVTDVVFEGRDLGSFVFPEAELKIFLTGSDEIRARRRFDELVQKYPHETTSFEKVLSELRERDYIDTHRKISPLKQAEDAVLIDTSDLTIEEIVSKIIELATRDRK